MKQSTHRAKYTPQYGGGIAQVRGGASRVLKPSPTWYRKVCGAKYTRSEYTSRNMVGVPLESLGVPLESITSRP